MATTRKSISRPADQKQKSVALDTDHETYGGLESESESGSIEDEKDDDYPNPQQKTKRIRPNPNPTVQRPGKAKSAGKRGAFKKMKTSKADGKNDQLSRRDSGLGLSLETEDETQLNMKSKGEKTTTGNQKNQGMGILVYGHREDQEHVQHVQDQSRSQGQVLQRPSNLTINDEQNNKNVEESSGKMQQQPIHSKGSRVPDLGFYNGGTGYTLEPKDKKRRSIHPQNPFYPEPSTPPTPSTKLFER